MPDYIINALEELFGESVKQVKVVENSWYAAMHGRIWATTRKELILLNMSMSDFISRPELMLHEYYHVVKQWRTGELTAFKYLLESAKNGYHNNHYELDTNRFVQKHIQHFKQLLEQHKVDQIGNA